MKARTRISIALAALGLLAAAAGPATAANHRHSKHHLARASLAPLRPPAEIGDWGVIPPLDGPNSAIDGGATGDGPADDEECERYADAINEAQAEMNEDLDLGAGVATISDDLDQIAYLTGDGEDRGCFFID